MAERRGGKNNKYTVYNITMQTGRVGYICKKLHRIYEQRRYLQSLHTHWQSQRRAVLPLSYYFQPYLVTEFSFNREARGSIRLKSQLVNVSFKGRSKIKPIFKSPPPLPVLWANFPGAAHSSSSAYGCTLVCAGGGCCFLLSLASDSCLQGLA